MALIAPDTGKSLADGAIVPWEKKSSAAFHQMLEQVARHYGFSIFDPFESLSPKHREVILHGSGNEALEFTYDGEDSGYRYTKPFEGVIPNLERRYRETESSAVREEIRRYMTSQICRGCNGARLRRESLHYLIDSNSVAQVSHLPLDETRDWVRQLELNPVEAGIAAKLTGEIEKRLGFLIDVGLHYLTLDRTMDTLSTGEAQRVVLATQIGSALSGVLYILDEPTIGLHQRDSRRLVRTLKQLAKAGNTVVVVEHDEEIISAAIDQGLLPYGTPLDDPAWRTVKFEPGLSTAGRVSELSGRGVGMNVVKERVERLRGSIELESTPGQGTEWTMRVPMRVAIVDGLSVDVAVRSPSLARSTARSSCSSSSSCSASRGAGSRAACSR